MAASLVLVGLESVGKSALFRNLTGRATGDEANLRGSTVVVRRARLPDRGMDVVDTPGIRIEGDSAATARALHAIAAGDTVVLVARGHRAEEEIAALRARLPLEGRRLLLVLTFADKLAEEGRALVAHYRRALGVPVMAVNARDLDPETRLALLTAAEGAAAPHPGVIAAAPSQAARQPQRTVFEHARLGPWAALLSLLAIFLLPVYAAYQLSGWLQPLVDGAIIEPLKAWGAGLPSWLEAMLTGGYGVLTLGWYSFLWAFPVVALIGLGVAVGEEIGLKDRITTALDPWMRRIGLSGRDLIPVVTGFGCNVVAVFQSRACSSCHRTACVSLIAFGSACSYQIGASLSLFNVAGQPWLFLPYVGLLFLVGALHTRLWYGKPPAPETRALSDLAYLQRPRPAAVWWRLKGALKQFLLQAMPIFLAICAVAALLEFAGALAVVSDAVSPALTLLGLPADAAPGVVFSILRKDGLLVLNAGDGALLASMTAGQVFVLVWLASTLTACTVTLYTVSRELGGRTALKLAARQAATALVSALLLALPLTLL